MHNPMNLNIFIKLIDFEWDELYELNEHLHHAYMTQSFTCYSVYLFIIWFRNLMRSMHVYLTSFE